MEEVQQVAKTFNQYGDNYSYHEEDIGDTDDRQVVGDYVNDGYDDGQEGCGGIDNLGDDTYYDPNDYVADQKDGDDNPH